MDKYPATSRSRTLVDFVPFPGMASTDNNTQYPANQIMITGGGGTVTASGSMVAVPSTNQIGVGTTAPLGPFDVNVSASFRQGFTTQNVAIVSSLISNAGIQSAGTAYFGNIYSNGFIQTAGTETANAFVANIYGRFGQNLQVIGSNASINSTTGSIVNAGGEGIGGNLNVGGSVSTFTGAVGIGTANGVGIATTPNSANLWVYGNVVLANTATTTSGVIFTDGSRQTTAAQSTPSYGLVGTVQFAGSGNTFLGDSTNLWWDNTNKRLGIGTGSPANVLDVYATDWALFNTRPGAAARQEIVVGNSTSFGSIVGYDPSLSAAIGYFRLGTSAATAPAVAWNYVSSNYRLGINAITQPQNAMDINGAVAIGNNYAGLAAMTNTNGLSVQGQVGIGTFTPGGQLDITRNNNTSNANYHLQFQNGNTPGQININYLFAGVQKAYERVDQAGDFVWNSGNNSFYFNNESIGGGTAGTANFATNSTSFMNVSGTAVTFPAAVTISQGSGAQLSFTGGTSNWIAWNSSGVAAPTFSTSSVGTKLILYPNVSASTVDFALGIANATLWNSVPNSSNQFQWYAGTTAVATLSGAGVLTVNSISAGNIAVSGTASISTLNLVTALATASGGTGLTGFTAANNAIYSTSSSALTAGTLPVAAGGTGLSSTPVNGALDIGNGTGFTRTTLTAGTAIGISNGSGSITINNNGVTSAVAGTGISVSGATGAVTITNSGVTSLAAGTGISVSGSTGGVTVTNGGVTSAAAGTGVTVSGSTGAVTFSIGQAVATSSSVQFGSLGVGTAASGTTGEIRATNNVTAYYSDDRLKTRLGTIDNALDKVSSLSGFYYEANETAQALGYEVKKEVGISAQEVQAIMPEVVAPAPIDNRYLTVRYERMIPLLIEAIKELRAEVADLRSKAQ
jgi:Chaperone of endosialidase